MANRRTIVNNHRVFANKQYSKFNWRGGHNKHKMNQKKVPGKNKASNAMCIYKSATGQTNNKHNISANCHIKTCLLESLNRGNSALALKVYSDSVDKICIGDMNQYVIYKLFVYALRCGTSEVIEKIRKYHLNSLIKHMDIGTIYNNSHIDNYYIYNTIYMRLSSIMPIKKALALLFSIWPNSTYYLFRKFIRYSHSPYFTQRERERCETFARYLPFVKYCYYNSYSIYKIMLIGRMDSAKSTLFDLI